MLTEPNEYGKGFYHGSKGTYLDYQERKVAYDDDKDYYKGLCSPEVKSLDNSLNCSKLIKKIHDFAKDAIDDAIEQEKVINIKFYRSSQDKNLGVIALMRTNKIDVRTRRYYNLTTLFSEIDKFTDSEKYKLGIKFSYVYIREFETAMLMQPEEHKNNYPYCN